MACLNPNLKNFWRQKARNYVLYGGRASGKSWDAAGQAVALAQFTKLKFLCCRQYQNKISESVYSLIKSRIEEFGLLDDFKFTDSSILCRSTGSEFLFYGILRNFDEIKSTEGVDILWIEEAHNLSEEQWRVLAPTIRKEGSRIWIIFNPNLQTDFVYKYFVADTPKNTVIRKINYDENPFLSNTLLEEINNLKEVDYEEYEHVYLGVPYNDDDRVVIKRSWVEAAINAHHNIKRDDWFDGATIGFDVADDGGDKNAYTFMLGSVCMGVAEWKGLENELIKSTMKVMSFARDHDASIGYDSIGVGASVGSILEREGFYDHYKFNAGASVINPNGKYQMTANKDFFANLKAQAWWSLSDRFRNTYLAVREGRKFPTDALISISGDIEPKLLRRLIDELTTPLRDFDTHGKVMVESKKDLRKRNIKSPNIADSFVIASSPKLLARARGWFD